MSRAGRRRSVPILLAGLGGLAACGDSGGTERAGVRFDTVNAVIHVISGSVGEWGSGQGWAVPDSGLVIGAVEGPSEQVFGAVAGVALDDEGRVWVGDTQALEIRVFDRDGSFLRRVGRDGEGPGEFRNISGLARAPDGVAALDGAQARVTVFGPAGGVVRWFRLQRGYMVFEHGAPMAFDDSGRFHDRVSLASAPGTDSVAVVTYSSDGAPLDTALIAVRRPDHIMVTRNGMPYMSVPRPFAPQPSLAFGPDAKVHFTSGDAYRIAVLSPAGDTQRVFHREVPPRPVTDDEAATALAEVDEALAEAGARVDRTMDLPDAHPAIQRLRVDRTGHLWVLTVVDAEASRMAWSVHDPDGRYLGDLTTPLLNVMDIGEDYLAGVAIDELGVSRVRVLPVRRSRGAPDD